MIDTVDGLLNAVFWYNCKRFGLCGGNELVSFLFWTFLNSLKFLMKKFPPHALSIPVTILYCVHKSDLRLVAATFLFP